MIWFLRKTTIFNFVVCLPFIKFQLKFKVIFVLASRVTRVYSCRWQNSKGRVCSEQLLKIDMWQRPLKSHFSTKINPRPLLAELCRGGANGARCEWAGLAVSGYSELLKRAAVLEVALMLNHQTAAEIKFKEELAVTGTHYEMWEVDIECKLSVRRRVHSISYYAFLPKIRCRDSAWRSPRMCGKAGFA